MIKITSFSVPFRSKSTLAAPWKLQPCETVAIGGGFSRCGQLRRAHIFRYLCDLGTQICVPGRTGCETIPGHSVQLSPHGIFQLYEFVDMPDHIHLLIAPKTTVALERSMLFIKGGYSHRFTKEMGSRMEIWQRGFTNHRIHDWMDFDKHRRYIHLNPVRAGLVEFPKDYPYSSAHDGFSVDDAPQRLKPVA